MRIVHGVALAALLLTTAPGFAETVGSQTVTVDCDAGDSLAKALAEADRGGPSHIRVLGTCRGSFLVESAGIQLFGIGPGKSVIEGTEFDPAIQVTATERVVIRDLEIRDGAVGVRVLGPHSDVAVLRSRIGARNVCVWVSGTSEAYLNEVELLESELGLIVDDHSTGRLIDSVSSDHSVAGGTANTYSTLFVLGSEITGNGEFGLSGQRVTTVTISESTMADNGEIHAYADDRSVLHLWSNVTVGGEDDPTEFALSVDDMSKLQINHNVTVYGAIHGSRSSLVTIATSAVHGSALLYGFANLMISGSEFDGTVTCQTGADAVCSGGAVVGTEGCPSAPPGCGTPPAGATQPPEARPEVLLMRLDPDALRNLTKTSSGPR